MPCEQLSVTRESQGGREVREGKKVGGGESEREAGGGRANEGSPGAWRVRQRKMVRKEQ